MARHPACSRPHVSAEEKVGQTVAPENNMAEMRAQGVRKKRGHGI
jgi:hypothetical protein